MKKHLRDHCPGTRNLEPYVGPPKALCGSQLGITNNSDEVTCKTCLKLYNEKRTDAFGFLRQAILKQIVTRKEYEDFWDKVLVEQVMDA